VRIFGLKVFCDHSCTCNGLPFNFPRCKGIKILKLSMPWTDGSYIELETIELGTSQFRKLDLMTGFVFWRNKLTPILTSHPFYKKNIPKLYSFSNTSYHLSCIKGPKLIELATLACLMGCPYANSPRTSPIVKHKVNVIMNQNILTLQGLGEGWVFCLLLNSIRRTLCISLGARSLLFLGLWYWWI
jgi:hypothetical protein